MLWELSPCRFEPCSRAAIFKGEIMSQYVWDTYAVCPCGYKVIAPHGKLFHVHQHICSDCGRDNETWEVQTLKKISTSIWYKPWTWRTGYWINKTQIDKLEKLILPET